MRPPCPVVVVVVILVDSTRLPTPDLPLCPHLSIKDNATHELITWSRYSLDASTAPLFLSGFIYCSTGLPTAVSPLIINGFRVLEPDMSSAVPALGADALTFTQSQLWETGPVSEYNLIISYWHRFVSEPEQQFLSLLCFQTICSRHFLQTKTVFKAFLKKKNYQVFLQIFGMKSSFLVLLGIQWMGDEEERGWAKRLKTNWKQVRKWNPKQRKKWKTKVMKTRTEGKTENHKATRNSLEPKTVRQRKKAQNALKWKDCLRKTATPPDSGKREPSHCLCTNTAICRHCWLPKLSCRRHLTVENLQQKKSTRYDFSCRKCESNWPCFINNVWTSFRASGFMYCSWDLQLRTRWLQS